MFFSGFLLHYGCLVNGVVLGCASGGGFRWRAIMGMLSGTLRHDLRHARHFQGRTYRGNDHVGIFMLQALIPGNRRDETRVQVAIEVERVTNDWIRPAAGRAASGHRDWALLDPRRIAGTATSDLLRTLPGLFHLTNLNSITSIIRSGLKPG